MRLCFTNHNQKIKDVVLDKYPCNLKIIAYDIQKNIVCVDAIETTTIILNDPRNEFLTILIDESLDVSVKKRIMVLCYMDRNEWL